MIELGFVRFLINHDIVQHATSRGFYHVGRGSGANSIVAYCLGITDVDPIELEFTLLKIFETRACLPRFDIDFSYPDKDESSYIFRGLVKIMLGCAVLIPV